MVRVRRVCVCEAGVQRGDVRADLAQAERVPPHDCGLPGRGQLLFRSAAQNRLDAQQGEAHRDGKQPERARGGHAGQKGKRVRRMAQRVPRRVGRLLARLRAQAGVGHAS